MIRGQLQFVCLFPLRVWKCKDLDTIIKGDIIVSISVMNNDAHKKVKLCF